MSEENTTPEANTEGNTEANLTPEELQSEVKVEMLNLQTLNKRVKSIEDKIDLLLQRQS